MGLFKNDTKSLRYCTPRLRFQKYPLKKPYWEERVLLDTFLDVLGALKYFYNLSVI